MLSDLHYYTAVFSKKLHMPRFIIPKFEIYFLQSSIARQHQRDKNRTLDTCLLAPRNEKSAKLTHKHTCMQAGQAKQLQQEVKTLLRTCIFRTTRDYQKNISESEHNSDRQG
jgi:hypothetical protein